MKRAGGRTLSLLFGFVLAVIMPAAAAHAGDQADVSTGVRVEFPAGVTFTLDARAAAEITDVSLQLNTPGQRYGAYPRNVKPDFRPGFHVTASWTWRRFGSQLPPGADISYRWQITDAIGTVTETQPQVVRVDDNRFQWREVSDARVTVRWYRGDQRFGESLLASASEAIARMAAEQGIDLVRPVTAHVYGSQPDLYSALPGTPAWIGGISIGEYDAILIPISPDDSGDGQRALIHELTHELIYQMTFSPGLGSRVPAWVNEGLATVAEGATQLQNRRALADAVNIDAVPTLRTLGSGFSGLPGTQAQLAYAASESAVRFLLKEHGPERMRRLLLQLRDGRTIDDALLAVYGRSQDQVEDGWRRSLGLTPRDRGQGAQIEEPRPAAAAASGRTNTSLLLISAGAIVLTVLSLAVAAALFLKRRRGISPAG